MALKVIRMRIVLERANVTFLHYRNKQSVSESLSLVIVNIIN